jgi:ferredoxin
MMGTGAGVQGSGGAREYIGAATVREWEQESKGTEVISPPLPRSYAQTMDRRGFFRETLGRFGAANRNEEARETPIGAATGRFIRAATVRERKEGDTVEEAATVRERKEGDTFDPGIVGKRETGQEGVENRIAVLDRSLCMAWDDQPCQLCVIRCSRSGVALSLEDFKPVVREEKCEGCGECERACALVNHEMVAIRLIPDRRSV